MKEGMNKGWYRSHDEFDLIMFSSSQIDIEADSSNVDRWKRSNDAESGGHVAGWVIAGKAGTGDFITHTFLAVFGCVVDIGGQLGEVIAVVGTACQIVNT